MKVDINHPEKIINSTKEHEGLLYIFDEVNKKSLDVIFGGKDEFLRLQEIKDSMKTLPNNPYGMDMKKGVANAKVRHWCLNGVSDGIKFKLPNGDIQNHKLVAIQISKQSVVFFNPQIVRNKLATIKDAKEKAKFTERLNKTLALPRRESYYE